jgi:hypothetical protein
MIVKLTPKGIFYNPTQCIPWDKTNFPHTDQFGIKSNSQMYWRLRQLSFQKAKGRLTVTPIHYDINEKERQTFREQNPKYPISELIFIDVIWEKLEKHLYHYTPKAFEHLTVPKSSARTKTPDLAFVTTPTEQLPKIELTFKVHLKNVTFKTGFVELEQSTKLRSTPITIKIYNDAILQEFDYIKPFFGKLFGKKKITVKGFLRMEGGEIRQKNFQSPEIASINDETITAVKHLLIKGAITAPPAIAVDKSLFTNEDFFEGLHGEELGNTIRADEKELFEQLKGLEGVRNKKQLEYLAGRIHDDSERIRFTLHPNFGFLFCHKGKKMLHFIWELIDSHATYIWSCEYDEPQEQKVAKLEDIIGYIKSNGRNAFIRINTNEHFIFSRIIHEKAQLVQGFPKWKARLNEKLI